MLSVSIPKKNILKDYPQKFFILLGILQLFSAFSRMEAMNATLIPFQTAYSWANCQQKKASKKVPA